MDQHPAHTARHRSRARPGRAHGSGLRRSLLAATLVPVLVGGFMLQSRAGGGGERVLHEVVSHLARHGVDSIPDEELYEHAARGLLRSIGDPYAELFTPEQLAEFSRQSLRNSYAGLGMQISRLRDTAVVTRVFPGSPAALGGLQFGDRIVRAGGKAVVGLPLDSVTAQLLGPPGTTVQVELVRPGTGAVQQAFTRARIRYPSVPFALMLEDGIGYVPLEGFNDTSGDEVESALLALRKSGARAYVLDLRGNTGGSLRESIRISGLFLPQGEEILRAEYRNAPEEVYRATSAPAVLDAPLVVLTDGDAASASEIVAGALQDHDRAVIVGTETFGKGVVQDIFPLNSGWALKLTTGKWYTPSGRSIQRERVILPDGRFVEVSPDSAAPRPVFRSDAGRPVRGGGGVTPDLVIRPDTLEGDERELMQLLVRGGSEVSLVLAEIAIDLGVSAEKGFRVRPEWRDELYRRLQARGVVVDRARWERGATLVDRLLESRVAGLAEGGADAFRRRLSQDRQLQEALRVLRGARTQADALARVPAAAVPAA